MGFSEDCVAAVGAACVNTLDEEIETKTNHLGTGTGSYSGTQSNPGTVYVIRSSVTVDVDQNNTTIALFGWASYFAVVTKTMFTKILEGAVEIIAETSSDVVAGKTRVQASFGMITGVSSGLHTYDLLTKLNSSDATVLLPNSGIIAIVIKI